MGVFSRPDSKYWQLWLETAPKGQQRERTRIVVGTTATERKDSERLALQLYHERMGELAQSVHRLPVARPQIRFAAYAEWYRTHTIAHRAGARREGEMLDQLIAILGEQLVTAIDTHRVAEYHTARKATASARTINREVDLLKGMLRDACPKYLERSPLVGMKRLRVVPPRRRYVTIEEFDRILDACEDGQDTAILVLGRDGLARLGDLLDLQHTDRDDRMLYVRDPKGGEPYEMALSDRALAAVIALPRTSTFLFPKFRRAANPRDWPGSVRQRLEYLCRQAEPPVPYGRTQNGVTFHWGTRRSGATDYLMTHKRALKGVQAQGNWKKPDVLLDIYTEVTREDKLAVVGVTTQQRGKAQR